MAEAAARGRALTIVAEGLEREQGRPGPPAVSRLEQVTVPGVLELDGPGRLLRDMAFEEMAEGGAGGATVGAPLGVREAGQVGGGTTDVGTPWGGWDGAVVDWEMEVARDREATHRLARPDAELN